MQIRLCDPPLLSQQITVLYVGQKSRADFINKTSIVEEEADESSFWLELIVAADLMTASHLQPLIKEAGEITAILVASRKTAAARAR